jgi:hypothetical protein
MKTELSPWHRVQRSLSAPIPQRPKFELLEEIRLDLFTKLDIVTTNIDPEADAEIQNIADRLKEITRKRPRALRAAIRAGRVEEHFTDQPHCRFCHQQTPKSTEYDNLLRCLDCGTTHRISEWADNAHNCPTCDSENKVMDRKPPLSLTPAVRNAIAGSAAS